MALLMAWVKPGMTEMEISAELSRLLKEAGSEGNSFGPMVQTGPNSAVPHGGLTQRALERDEFLLIDFGGLWNGYPADITRTFCLGTPTDEMNRIYQTVLAANRAAVTVSKPGVPCGDVDKAARDVIESAGYGEHFFHRTGHGLGMSGHELPQIAAGVEEVLETGMVQLLQVSCIRHRFGGRRSCRRQPGADHQRVRISFFDALVGDAQQASVFCRVGRASAPFARQVGFVPNLVSVNASLVA